MSLSTRIGLTNPDVFTLSTDMRRLAASMTETPLRFHPALKPSHVVDIKTAEPCRCSGATSLTPVGLRSLAAGEPGYAARYEGDSAPVDPKGCPFQAWSLGELLRLERVVLREPKRAQRDRRVAQQAV